MESGVTEDQQFPSSWHEVARRWGLAPAQLPEAVRYVCTALRAAEGELEPVEVQIRPAGERYIYRIADPARAGQRISANRPPHWDEALERQAVEDVYVALAFGFDDGLRKGDAQAA